MSSRQYVQEPTKAERGVPLEIPNLSITVKTFADRFARFRAGRSDRRTGPESWRQQDRDLERSDGRREGRDRCVQ